MNILGARFRQSQDKKRNAHCLSDLLPGSSVHEHVVLLVHQPMRCRFSLQGASVPISLPTVGFGSKHGHSLPFRDLRRKCPI